MQAAEVFRLGVICFSQPATRADKQQRWLMKKVELYRRDLQRLPAVGTAAVLALALCHVAAPPDALSGFLATIAKHPLLTPVKCCCKEVMAASTAFLLDYENAQSHAKRCLDVPR